VNLTAQQMLASLPVRRYADGGEATNVVPSWQADASAGRARAIAVGNEEAWLAQVKATAEKYMQNPGTAAEAYDAMVKSGIGIKDLLDSGISQDTINRALSIPTAEAQKQVNALATTAITSTLAQNPTLANEIANRGAPAIYEQARQFVANLQKDGLTDAERQYMQQVASQQGWGYSDIRAAGIDPTILFSPVPEVKKPPVTPVTPVTPAMPGTVTPVFQPPVPYTPVNVYQPLPTQPDIYAPGQPALDVAFRESAPRTAIPGMPGSYEYTPAAKLRPATGAGYSWTPPSVTSRPRSLLSPTLLSYVSPSQQFAQSRAAQDQALLGAFRSSGLPQNASNFYSWRNRLRSGEFGAGSAFDPTAFQSAFSSWASSQPPAAGTTAQGSAAPLGSVTGYSEIAGGLQPIDLRAMPFAEGGEVSAREMLARLKKPEGIEAEGLGAQTPRNLPRERMNARRARAGMEPFVPQAPTKTAGQTAADMLSGMSIPLSVVPVAGDVAGLAADAAMYAAYPEERTLANYGLTALGALPFVPAASAARTGKKAAEALKELSEAERKANLERFMAGSKVIDESGQPVVQYRGMTHGDIDPTQTKGGRKLIFTTPDKSTANNFAMIRGRDPDASPYVAPLYVRAQNPFDFTNKAHIAQMERELPKILSRSSPSREPMTRSEIKDAIAAIRRGDWGAIEDVAENTDYFERAGFDSLYVNEGGVKNLAVFDPTQIKSAIGNEGTFDPANPVITKKDGGEVSTEELIAQMDRIGAGPAQDDSRGAYDLLVEAERRAANKPDRVRTESRGLLDRLNAGVLENVTEPVAGSLVDMTVGLGDIGQMATKYLAGRTRGPLAQRLLGADPIKGVETEPYTPMAPRVREALGLSGYDPEHPVAVGTQIAMPALRAATTVGRAANAANALQMATRAPRPRPGSAQELLMRIAGEGAAETQRYAGAELGATIARDVAPGNTAAELLSAVAGSTVINTLQSLDPRDLNRVMTGMTQVYSHRPTPERPFVGRLDSYIANLDVGRITPKELLARMQGKFRGPELLRVERAFDGADMNAKLTPSEVLEKLQGAYDPSDLELVTLRKPAPYRNMDNPWEDSPDSMQSTIILRRSGQAVPPDIAKRAESAKEALRDIETLRQGDSITADSRWAQNLLDPDTLDSYTESLARAFSGQRDDTSQFVLERLSNIKSLARGRQRQARELGVILSRAGEVSQELFDAEKTRLLQQGGMPSRDLLNQAYVNAFKQNYDNLVAATALASRYPDNFNNLPTPDNVTTPEQATEFIQRTLEYAIDERIFRLSNSTRARIAEQLNLLRKDEVYNELKRLSSLKVPMTPPGVNPEYKGQHTSVTDDLPGVISFSRATDTTADIPGMGQTQGIYLHELQSDLLDDLRKRGGGIPRGTTPKQ
jgi:hypothetical protein